MYVFKEEKRNGDQQRRSLSGQDQASGLINTIQFYITATQIKVFVRQKLGISICFHEAPGNTTTITSSLKYLMKGNRTQQKITFSSGY